MTTVQRAWGWLFVQRRHAVVTASAGFTAFVNLYALQSILPLLAETWQVSQRQASLTVGASTLAVALAAPFAGCLVQRFPRRQIAAWATVGLTLCGLQVAAAPTLSAMIGWRFLQGLFLPLVIAGVMAFIAERFEPRQVGQVMANYVAWTIVGGFSGRWLCGLMAASCDWRTGLTLLALLNGLSGGLMWCSLPRDSGRRSDSAPNPGPAWAALLSTLVRRDLWPAYMMGLGSLMTLTGVFTYITFHLSQAPFALGPAALGKMFCVYLVGIVVTPCAGRLLPALGPGRVARWASVLSAGGLVLSLAPRIGAVALGLAAVSVAAFICQSAASAYVAQRGGEQRALASGLYLSFYYLGGGLGALLPGYAWELGRWPACVALFLILQWGISQGGAHLAQQGNA